MDAAQNNSKKIVLILASALLLTAPVYGTTLSAPSTLTLGNTYCNNFQTFTVASSDVPIPFTVAVTYNTPANGNWLYVKNGSGSTSTGATFSTSTGTSGVQLTTGLNSSFAALSDTAYVVLTPTDINILPKTVTVNYQQNSSCSGGTGGSATNGIIIVAPGTVALTAGIGFSASQPLTIQNTQGQSILCTIGVSDSWLSPSVTSITVAANQTVSVTVTGSAAGLSSTGTLNGTVTINSQLALTAVAIPVSFVVTTGSGGGGGGGTTGTLTLNGATSNVYSTSFSYTAPNTPGGQCVPIQDTAPGANSYTYAVTATGGWLLANYGTNGSTPGLLAPSSNACVTLTLSNSATSLTSGVYPASVALTSSSGSTATINATLFVSGGAAPGITVSPGLIYTFPNVAVGSTTSELQAFTITAASGYNLGTATAPGQSWFAMTTPVISGGTETFTVIVNPTGLSAGLYYNTITVPSSSGSGSASTSILIVVPVGQGSGGGGGGGGGATSLVAPTSLQFQQQSGNDFWRGTGEKQAITITGQQGTQWSAAITYGAGGSNWLTFNSPASGSGTFGSGPATLLVDLFNGVSALAPSSTPYTASVNITTPGGTTSVPVSVLVTPSNTPVLIGLPSSLTFSSSGSQAVQVVGSDNPSSGTSPLISVGTPTASWISASASGNTMTVTVNATGQTTGVYSGTIPVSNAGYANPINYPVVLVVNGGGGGSSSGPLTLSSSSLTFTNVTNQISTALTVTAASSTSVTATTSLSSCTSTNWLSISPAGVFTASPAATQITVTVNPVGIANGTTCTGTIALATASATQNVNVSMTVGSASGGGNVVVTPTTMSFAYTQGQTVPAAQTATVVNAVSGTAAIPFTVTTAVSGGVTNWLQTSVTSGQTPFNNPGLSVSVVPGSLNAGTYQGTVTVTPIGGSVQTINVSLTVAANPVVTATPTTLSLSYIAGGTSPTGTIQVSAGGATAGFTAVASSSTGWLKVSPTSGTTPNTGTSNLSVTLDATALAALLPGSYTGTIVIAGVSPATGTTNVNVTLNITAPLPTIISITNSASFASGGLSPGELISIFADKSLSNPIGPTPPVQLNSINCPNGCLQLPTTLGGVQVVFLPSGFLAPLTFVSGAQINAIVPYEVSGPVSVQVRYLNQTSNAFPVNVGTVAPGIFTALGTGTGQAAANQYDNTGAFRGGNSPATPAQRGWVLALYLTGEGIVNPAAKTGSVTQGFAVPFVVPTVTIDGQPATVAAYAEAVGLVSGVLQVNVIIPQAARSGSAIPLTVSLGTSSAQTGVTVAIQ